MEIIQYLPVKRTAAEELKWIEMQNQMQELIKQLGDKYILSKSNEVKHGPVN